jgi:hypothetical protein
MAEAAAMPTRAEAVKWVGASVSEIDGTAIGEAQGFYVDEASRGPVWLIARVGKRRNARVVAVPLRACAGAAFGVWIALEGEALRTAPVVDPTKPLRREHELTICSHFGIGEGVGRAAEVVARGEGTVTASPLGGLGAAAG